MEPTVCCACYQEIMGTRKVWTHKAKKEKIVVAACFPCYVINLTGFIDVDVARYKEAIKKGA